MNGFKGRTWITSWRGIEWPQRLLLNCISWPQLKFRSTWDTGTWPSSIWLISLGRDAGIHRIYNGGRSRVGGFLGFLFTHSDLVSNKSGDLL